jgi:hypothetical protein
MANKIDHFAIGALTLDQGAADLKEVLGVTIPRGGKHDLMATHNCVAQAGNNSFIEILAIDPEAGDPGRPRWFTLDSSQTQERLVRGAGALCWVVGTDNLDAVIANSPIDLGEVVTFTRGDRSWRLTVTPDGSLPEHALLPAFIEWSPGAHPSTNMQDLGLTLARVVLRHPDPQRLTEYLEALDVAHLADVVKADTPALSFVVNTADGREIELS